jgi:hypothetical protein
MKTQHTPGPWAIQGGFITAHDGAGYEKAIAKIKTGRDWPLVQPAKQDEAEAAANARLIAAAPDLLAALEHAVFELEEKTGVYTGDFQALIKKAKGE